MFDTLKSLAKAAVATATVPLAIAADAVTCCGIANDRKEAYTVTAAKSIEKNLKRAVE